MVLVSNIAGQYGYRPCICGLANTQSLDSRYLLCCRQYISSVTTYLDKGKSFFRWRFTLSHRAHINGTSDMQRQRSEVDVAPLNCEQEFERAEVIQ